MAEKNMINKCCEKNLTILIKASLLVAGGVGGGEWIRPHCFAAVWALNRLCKC